jgi:transcriptional regulator with XRE-family HTH domain
MKLSDQVRQAIAGCGLSRYAISKATGISQATLSRFAAGERGLTTTALDTLADFLDLDITVAGVPVTERSK